MPATTPPSLRPLLLPPLPILLALLLPLCSIIVSATTTTTTTTTITTDRHGNFHGSQALQPQIIISGDLLLDGSKSSLARLDLVSNLWSTKYHPELYLYGESDSTVYKILSNHSKTKNSDSKKENIKSELIVVGAFDTTCEDCQIQYCSVGKWSGYEFTRVGEGLCNSALSLGMKITTASMAGSKNLYVGGSFYTRAWNGEVSDFVKIFNVAHFNATSNIWAPLKFGQLTCSWCRVTVLALAWDEKTRTLHIGGKFNSIDGKNIRAGLAMYSEETGHLVAHPGGGLSFDDIAMDGVATALQFDPVSRVLYVMGSFDRLTQTGQLCHGLAAYETDSNIWTCLADELHSVEPSSGGNMLLTAHGLIVAGKANADSTWMSPDKPYTIALLSSKKNLTSSSALQGYDDDDDSTPSSSKPSSPTSSTEFSWSWLPGFPGHSKPLHTLANGFGEYENYVYVGGEDYLASWTMTRPTPTHKQKKTHNKHDHLVPVTTNLLGKSNTNVTGSIMSVAQLTIPLKKGDVVDNDNNNVVVVNDMNKMNISSMAIYFLTLGTLIGLAVAIICNRQIWDVILNRERSKTGISLDTLSYGSVENSDMEEAMQEAMKSRHLTKMGGVQITLIDPKEIVLQRIIGEGTFGRVWVAKWRSSQVAVKEFVFAQAAVMGRSTQRKEIIEEIVGEAGTMSCLRHPHILQLFGCSLTSQAIWIVSEVCCLGSLRQVLDDSDRSLSTKDKLKLAIDVADGMVYLHGKEPAIIHRDLKSHNIFVHEAGGIMSAKIGDWGSARAALAGNRTMTHGVGTACWLAPEVIKHSRASKLSDAYGFAIVLWELATRIEVYKGLTTMQIIAQVANEGLRPGVPEEECVFSSIMQACWDENPRKRYQFDRILKELQALLVDCEAMEENNDADADEESGLLLRGRTSSKAINVKKQKQSKPKDWRRR
ncbi:hypothetical protein TrLO_g11893 [Triparma laevis f. longispina]|uniref:Protein kinase domain-containing protein n=1 Tax=Triparma laevis f. longispina TaxID=1714387 RepID=A0A9W7ATE0_9STRA|nr:hypothetical protein TrLO_g11893 [Triparma laevis f. longispina]